MSPAEVAPASLTSVSLSNSSLRPRAPIAVDSENLPLKQTPLKLNDPTINQSALPSTKQTLASNATEKPFHYIFEDSPRVYIPGSEEDKKLVRIIDLHILPCICFLYLLNYLDRSSIGNARIGGMEKDLELSSADYSLAVLIFFVGYLLAEIPSNMLLTRVRPSIFIPLITFGWGLIATVFSVVKTKEGLIGVRFVLGFMESGFFPGVLFLLSSWYRKTELAKRIGILYTASILAGAFGGLISGGVITGLNEARGIRGWRWLFIIEGAITMFASMVAVFFMPDWPSNTKWLTPEQRALAAARLAADRPAHADPRLTLTHLQAFKAAVTDWRVYLFCLMDLMITSETTISYFIPTITRTLGYKGQMAQFMTVPIYICTFVGVLANSLSADFFNDRVFHVAIPTAVAGVMYAICAGISNSEARYGLICIGYAATFGALPVVLAWLSRELNYPDSKRAISQALVNSVGNSASIYGSFLWSDAPKFTHGFVANSVFCFTCSIIAIIGHLLFTKYPSMTTQLQRDAELSIEIQPTNTPLDERKDVKSSI
ncbi:uncharacterized protein MELLADRAFT_32946 [Melampsora larici-populina 98AG31]|uniref:Major facilitator superfamily (MFS) profile domain-containing protein n=1 Tax=Melampsora larici-populina (strain 98AG31 / pathotype 3-4-7) TaxID=747676 RepID=F4R6S6_MELLP|nr:uncharacterized protein MELLADRAFT_32946 [Melampsora larici-populina 98AG31]EGG11927.1 hypothetical protein MELLADRAFT_32946 [Melampsora larici-populina 98AG31]